MAFTLTAHLPGNSTTYTVNPACKRYTLRDNGFTQTKAGNFEFIRNLSDHVASNRGVRLKIMVAKDLQTLKMSTTTVNGMSGVNVYDLADNDMLIEKIAFILAGLVERNVLAPAED